MILFNERLQLEREFYEWAAKNHVLTDPFTVITWLTEVRGFINPGRIKTLHCRKLVEKSLLRSSRLTHQEIEKIMVEDMLISMADLLKDEMIIEEEEYIPERNMQALTGHLKVVTPEGKK